jgi:protein SCO1/2
MAVRKPADGKEFLPLALEGITVAEKLGGMVDGGLRFTDHQGRMVHLADYLDGEKPVLLTLNYYRCKMLCNLQLNALLGALQGMGWKPGEQYRIVTLSIDPREGWELARDKRESYLKALGLGAVEWNFLRGEEPQIRALAESIGYTYRYDGEQDQWAHTPAIFFLSPTGKISRYLYGLTYVSRDVRLALVEAAEGKVGGTVDRLLLSCFHYDSSIGAYAPFAWGVMRAGAVGIVASLAVFLSFMWRIERRRALLEQAS